MDLEEGNPRIVERKMGGFLAVSPPESRLQIGVCAESAEAAAAKLRAATADWERTLASVAARAL